tara:strand:- start:33430 stop:34386 length:957 start_codon:yes stop_codon:yes gene_type:complete
MIRIKNGLQKRKMKIFMVFLLFSSLAWFISKLSENYTGRAVFALEYKNVPDSLLFVGASKNQLDVKLSASGFSFLRFSFGNKKIKIDVAKAQEKNNVYTVPKNAYQLQIERQLPQSMELKSIDDGEAIILELYPLFTKKIPIISNLDVELEQNFMLEGGIQLKPDSITINGPKKEVDKFSSMKTEVRKVENISGDFSEKLALLIPEDTKNIKFSDTNVNVYAKVVRFSEKVIKVPISVANLPESYEIKIFPDIASVLCKAKIDNLKELKPTDFKVIADYNLIIDKEQQTIPLELKGYPKNLNTPKLMEKEVTYILKRK